MEIVERLNARWNRITSIAPGLIKDRVLRAANRLATVDQQRDLEFLPPGKKKEQLENLSTWLKGAITAMGATDPYLQKLSLGLDSSMRGQLEKLRQHCEERIPTSGPRSGGRGRLDLHLKRRAAIYTHIMMMEIGKKPTLTRDGPWIKFTEILFYVATGRRSGDVIRACTRMRDAVNSPDHIDEVDIDLVIARHSSSRRARKPRSGSHRRSYCPAA